MTYSIVARDPLTGRYGVAVQSHAYTVGPIVPWLEAGVGAIATQAFVNIELLLPTGMEGGKVSVAFGVDNAAAAQQALGELATVSR